MVYKDYRSSALYKHLKFKTEHFHSCNTVKYDQIGPQTREIWPKQLNFTLSVSESVNGTLFGEKLGSINNKG